MAINEDLFKVYSDAIAIFHFYGNENRAPDPYRMISQKY